MGKLNYANRKSEGVKLGQIVAKDLRRRIKSSITPTKVEAHRDTSLLELHLEGKSLTDNGMAEVSRGLEDVLGSPNSKACTRLQSLNISNNALTVRSLADLAMSIRLASEDLEDLDLSGNGITIITNDDAHYWEDFLTSLGQCSVLKRIDLGGNSLGGTRSMEVLVRVYLRQFRECQEAWEYIEDADGGPDANGNGFIEPIQAISIGKPNGFAQNQSLPKMPRGLPCIPTLVLCTSNLTDSGALFLSYIVATHRWTQHILGRSPVYAVPQLAINQKGHGIVFLPNEQLSAVGLRLLAYAEAVPYEPFDASVIGKENSPIGKFEHNGCGGQRRVSSVTSYERKISIASEVSGKSPINDYHATAEELESLRRKIQRSIIEELGPVNIQMWRAALKLLALVRRTMITIRPVIIVSPPKADESLDRRPKASYQSIKYSTYASKLILPTVQKAAPASAVNGVSATASTPHVMGCPTRRGHRSSGSCSSDSMSQRATIHEAGRFREAPGEARPELIGPLPARAWEMLLGTLADPRRVLSEHQRKQVFIWGRDRRTLATEAEGLGKPTSVQIWRVLEGMGCLAYDGRA